MHIRVQRTMVHLLGNVLRKEGGNKGQEKGKSDGLLAPLDMYLPYSRPAILGVF